MKIVRQENDRNLQVKTVNPGVGRRRRRDPDQELAIMEAFLLLPEKLLSMIGGEGMPLYLSIRPQRLRAILEDIFLAKDPEFDFLFEQQFAEDVEDFAVVEGFY
jgi:hypothetical protein